MTDNALATLVMENWMVWSTGGLDSSVIATAVQASDRNRLYGWLAEAGSSTQLPVPQVELKRLFDLATWCILGTHNLFDMPRELRNARILRASEQFGVDLAILRALIVSAPSLERPDPILK